MARAIPFSKYPAKFGHLVANMRNVALRAAVKVEPTAKKIVQTATKKAPPTDPNSLNRGGAIDTTLYYNSWFTTVINNSRRVGVIVYNSTGYANYIEYGRGAGRQRPPISVILAWAQRKLRLPYNQAKKAAFAIANAIAKRGLRPRLVLTGQSTESKFLKATSKAAVSEIYRTAKRWSR